MKELGNKLGGGKTSIPGEGMEIISKLERELRELKERFGIS
jgi:hypothetical protein